VSVAAILIFGSRMDAPLRANQLSEDLDRERLIGLQHLEL